MKKRVVEERGGSEEFESGDLEGMEYLDAVVVRSPFSIHLTLAKQKSRHRQQKIDLFENGTLLQREVLRIEPPLSAAPRTALKDDLIPLSTPIPSATDPTKMLSHVAIKRGQTFWVSIYCANRNKEIFGEDADEFRPERWLDRDDQSDDDEDDDGAEDGKKEKGSKKKNKKIESKMGIWAGQMTFLAGPRSCIGYKFA